MEGMGLKFTPVVACFVPLPGTSSPNSPFEWFNPPPAAHPFPYMCHSWYYSGYKEGVAQNPAVLAS